MKEQELNMIETKEFQLTEKEYFDIIYFQKLKTDIISGVLKILFILFLLYQYLILHDTILLWCILIPFIYEILYGFYIYYGYVKNEENKNIYLKRKIIFDNENLYIFLDNAEKLREIDFKYLVKIADRPKYWLLYINKSNFHYIPKNIFDNIEHFLAFKDLINKNTLSVKRIK